MGTLNVTVTDGTNKMEDAKVVLTRNGTRTIERTGRDGVARFENIDNAQYDIEVTKPYYTIHTGTVSVSGTVNRQYALSEVSGSTLNSVTSNDGQVVFENTAPGDYYVILEHDTWEDVVAYETMGDSPHDPIYYLREIRSNITISITNSEGSPLTNAIVQLGNNIRPTDDSGDARFTVDNGEYQLIVSHPEYNIHSKRLNIDDHGSHVVSLTDPDPDTNAPPHDATFIGHASIETGESISVTVEEDEDMDGTYEYSDTVELSNGYNEIPLNISGGASQYRWRASFGANTIEKSPDLFAGNVHIGLTSVAGVVEVNGINIPVYQPSSIPTPQLQFATNEGPLSAKLKDPSPDDVMQVEVNGTVYGVEI